MGKVCGFFFFFPFLVFFKERQQDEGHFGGAVSLSTEERDTLPQIMGQPCSQTSTWWVLACFLYPPPLLSHVSCLIPPVSSQ